MPHTVREGVIFSEVGLPEPPRWFADNRLAFALDERGISQVDYHYPNQALNTHTIFLRRLWEGFRVYLEQDLHTYAPEYCQVQILPFGLQASWQFKGYEFNQRVMALDYSIVFQVDTPGVLPANLRFKLEFFEVFGLIGNDSNDFSFSNAGIQRQWKPWVFHTHQNALLGGFADRITPSRDTPADEYLPNNPPLTPDPQQGGAQTSQVSKTCEVCIGANFPIDYILRPRNGKHILKSPSLQAGQSYAFAITFAPTLDEVEQRSTRLLADLPTRIHAQYERYRRVAENSPRLSSPFSDLDDFISLAPLYHESLKVTDHPGALRAKTTNYWVWGWDGMTSNEGPLYWGDAAFIRDMLYFYEQTAHPDLGIGHAFNHDMSLAGISSLPAQSFYITLLYQYYTLTRDAEAVRQHFPFASLIFRRILQREVGETGLCEGTSLYPDFLEYMKETGHDLSAFNNTILYCAARGMEQMAALVGDGDSRDSKTQSLAVAGDSNAVAEIQALASRTFRRIETNFVKLFFDPQVGFIANSLDSVTLARRAAYSAAAVKLENNFCQELVEPVEAECLKFMEENCVSPAGLREIPLWCDSFDLDSNQLHCWWPVNSEFYTRLINRQNHPDRVQQWIGWVSAWMRRLTIPEGIPCYTESAEPEFDAWNCLKGTWQAYSIRGWYQAALHSVVGVDVDLGGLTVYPYDGEEMRLEGLHALGRRFDIDMRGRGQFISRLVVNGVEVPATHKVPTDLYRNTERCSIRVERGAAAPYPFHIRSANGIEIKDLVYSDGCITAHISGLGTNRLKIGCADGKAVAACPPVISVDSQLCQCVYDARLGLATVELNLKPGEIKELTIS